MNENVVSNPPVHGLEQLLALRRGPRCQGDEIIVVDVHSLWRPVPVLEEERGVLRLGTVFPHRRRRRPHVPGAIVVLHDQWERILEGSRAEFKHSYIIQNKEISEPYQCFTNPMI